MRLTRKLLVEVGREGASKGRGWDQNEDQDRSGVRRGS
jgi:hypothetical protein